MFALDFRPQNPALQPGELLLLQLVKQAAISSRKLHSRVDFALVFDRFERDHDGTISRRYWPQEGRTWKWILYCSKTVPTIPFSLEDLNLSRSYDGQDNARYISPEDEKLVLPYIQWALAEIPEPDKQMVPVSDLPLKFGRKSTLSAIFNYDRILALRPPRKKTVTLEQPNRNQGLSDSLKLYYGYYCQICNQAVGAPYGVKVADTHHIQYLSRGGPDISSNIIVVCPNHHNIIHATDAYFDRAKLAYIYPNSLQENLVLTDHLVASSEE